MIVVVLVVLQLSATPADNFGCTDQELQSIRLGEAMMARGDDPALRQALEKEAGPGARFDRCTLRRLQRSAFLGWGEARAVAPRGGAAELLAPVRSALNELQQIREDVPAIAIDVEYAQMAVRAAVAAAQDERAEMELLLVHARDLSERLASRGRRAIWPRPFNLLAGELWFEVDRFEEARAAYDRAVRGEASGAALVGLARAQARLGLRDQACATYKRVADVAASLRKSAASEISQCR